VIEHAVIAEKSKTNERARAEKEPIMAERASEYEEPRERERAAATIKKKPKIWERADAIEIEETQT
jgi:hypothetical protein